MATMTRVMVTGGGGFVGKNIVKRLRARGIDVHVLARGSYPELEALGCTMHRVDLADTDGVTRALAGCDTVFHVAARAGVWGPRQAFENANVRGAENVLAACHANGVQRLVFTSSPSVTFDGTDHVDASNDLPYPTRWLSDYPRTKALGEAAVLAAASPDLHVVALRPHLVYGPDDPHLLPRLLARARAGRLRIVGDGTNRVSLTYVDNAAVAHLQAVDSLLRDGAASPAHGRAFFVNDAEPVVLWDWLNRLFGEVGVDPVRARVPAGLAYLVGSVAEGAWSLLGRTDDPPMTRFVARQLATSHTYSLAPAREAFGYVPEVEGDDAFRRTVAWIRMSGFPAS